MPLEKCLFRGQFLRTAIQGGHVSSVWISSHARERALIIESQRKIGLGLNLLKVGSNFQQLNRPGEFKSVYDKH